MLLGKRFAIIFLIYFSGGGAKGWGRSYIMVLLSGDFLKVGYPEMTVSGDEF